MAELRIQARLTQAELAGRLGLKQQLIAAYEKGSRRIPLSYLKPLAEALSVEIEDLLGTEKKPRRRGPAPVLLKKLEQIQRLPPAKQKTIVESLEMMIDSAGSA